MSKEILLAAEAVSNEKLLPRIRECDCTFNEEKI